MKELVVHFELDEQAQPEPVAGELEEALRRVDGVAEAEAVPSTERFGVIEAALAVTAAVTLVRSSRTLVDELTSLVASLKKLAAEVRGVKGVVVEVGGERVPLEQLTEERVRELV